MTCDYVIRSLVEEEVEGKERRYGHMSLSFSPPPSCVFIDQTFPIDSEVIVTTYPVSWVQCVVQVLMLCVRKWPSMLPSPLPLPQHRTLSTTTGLL